MSILPSGADEVGIAPYRAAALARAGEAPTALDLMQMAIAKGATPGDLRELAELHRDMMKWNAELEFSRDLVAFQASCPAIPREDVVDYGSSPGKRVTFRYASFETMRRVLDPYAHKLGFAFTFKTEMQGPVMIRTCTLWHRNGHSISAPVPITTTSSNPGMSEQQKYAAAETSASRRALASVLGLSLTEADEQSEAGAEPVSEAEAANIEALLTETNANRVKFMEHFRIAAIAGLTTSQYGEAARMLEQKRKAVAR